MPEFIESDFNFYEIHNPSLVEDRTPELLNRIAQEKKQSSTVFIFTSVAAAKTIAYARTDFDLAIQMPNESDANFFARIKDLDAVTFVPYNKVSQGINWELLNKDTFVICLSERCGCLRNVACTMESIKSRSKGNADISVVSASQGMESLKAHLFDLQDF